MAGSRQLGVLVEESVVESAERLAAVLGLCLEAANMIGIGECATIVFSAGLHERQTLRDCVGVGGPGGRQGG